MAITDTSPNETAVDSTRSASTATGSLVPSPRGLAGVLGTGDHLTIGRLYIGFSLVFGVACLGLWLWYGVNAMATTPDGFAYSAFTLSQLGLVFLFAMPLFVGLATAIVPLQVGASTVAFPRAAAAAFWTWLLAAVLFCISYLPAMGGGVGGAKADSVSLTYVSLAGLVVALLLGTVCVLTTVIALRSPGMGLDRVPAFSWSMVVAGGAWMLTLPLFLANVALIFVDNKYGKPSNWGVDYNQWPQLSWLVTQPQVFAFAIPVLGIAADAVATLARARQPQRGILLGAIGVFGALSFGAYAQVKYNPELFHQWPFVAQCALLVLPLLALLGGFVAVLRNGKPRVASPLILGLVAVLVLVLAALAATPFGLGRLQLQTTSPLLVTNAAIRSGSAGSPIYTWGVFAMVVVAVAAGGVAGLFYWAAKITGKALADGIGKLLGAVFLLAALLAGVPFLVLGFANKSQSLADSANAMISASMAGAGLAALGLVIAFVVFIAARGSVIAGGATADDDAWECGQSLEWACASPPAQGNFGALAEVTSPQPLLDLAENGAQS